MTDEGKTAETAKEQGSEIDLEQQRAGDDSETLESLQAELEDTRKALAKANRESATRRKKLEELEAAEQEREEAELSEMEKLQKQLADQKAEIERVQNEARQVRIKSAVVAKAAQMNFVDPEDAYALMDKSEIEIDGNEIAGVDEALDKLKESKPYMIKQAQKKTAAALATNPGDNITGQGETDEQRRARLYGRGADAGFHPETAREHGGGVFINE